MERSTMLLMGKPTISMAMFNSYVSHYQRVPSVYSFYSLLTTINHHFFSLLHDGYTGKWASLSTQQLWKITIFSMGKSCFFCLFLWPFLGKSTNEALQMPSGQAMATALAFRLLQPLGKAAGAWGHLSSAPGRGTLRLASELYIYIFYIF